MSTAPAPSKKTAAAASKPRVIRKPKPPEVEPVEAAAAEPGEDEFFGDLPSRQELPPALQMIAQGGQEGYELLIDAARAINPALPEQLDGCVVTISAQKNGVHIHLSADVMALSQHSVTPQPTELDPNPQPVRWRP